MMLGTLPTNSRNRGGGGGEAAKLKTSHSLDEEDEEREDPSNRVFRTRVDGMPGKAANHEEGMIAAATKEKENKSNLAKKSCLKKTEGYTRIGAGGRIASSSSSGQYNEADWNERYNDDGYDQHSVEDQ
ncbi:hypothetical protein CSUI_005972, partial [Cystoisospora suis]